MSDIRPVIPHDDRTDEAYQLRPLAPWPPFLDLSDALSDPSAATIAETLYAALPQGAAWRSPDGAAFDANSRMGGLLRAFAAPLAALYRRLFGATLESTAVTLSESLADWENEFGLPDPCLDADGSVYERRIALLTKIRSTGVITPADFVALAASIGYDITIDEPEPFRCGESRCGEDGAEISGLVDVSFYWIVRIRGLAVSYFHVGEGQAGVTPLSRTYFPSDLICMIRRHAPAWTMPIFQAE